MNDDALHRTVEVQLMDVLTLLAAGEDRRFVGDVRKVGAGKAGGLAGDETQVNVGRERLAACMHAQNRLSRR